MASSKDDLSAFLRARKANRPKPVVVGSSAVEAGELRARAARYRQLAEILHDPHVVAEVQECARELDNEAAWIERQASYGTRAVGQRYRVGGN